MKVTPHGQYLTQLSCLMFFVPMNCYFVREEDGLTLIDSTVASSARGIAAAAEQLGMPIVRIALTHAHSDHVGAVDPLLALISDAELLISTRDGRALAGDHRLDPDERALSERGGFSSIAARPTRLLEHGDRVGSLEVIAAPGHTPGHIAFLDTRDRSLIAGDAFITHGSVQVAGTMQLLIPIPHMFTWHRPTAVESARRLRALASGHGRVVENPIPKMDRAIAKAEKALAKA
jgi:glyoxylase-like metal-dependent hydrolase (beta-lactamase superfamily II)